MSPLRLILCCPCELSGCRIRETRALTVGVEVALCSPWGLLDTDVTLRRSRLLQSSVMLVLWQSQRQGPGLLQRSAGGGEH